MTTLDRPATASRSDTLPRWLADLRDEVEAHAAVSHTLFGRLAALGHVRAFGLQHYALVGFFTRYMEWLLLRAPSSTQKLWLAKVLVDEYGEGSDGDDHPTLYRAFLRHAGAAEGEERRTPLLPEARGFVREHLRIAREEPFLVGLGALGPGHEWAIPSMFGRLVPGLRAAGLDDAALHYFLLHGEQDQDHGAWMSEALASEARSADEQALVRRGALLSLAARDALWSAIERALDGAAGERASTLDDLRTEVDAAASPAFAASETA